MVLLLLQAPLFVIQFIVMPTQKLMLLLLLVATLGGSAIWYMKTQINYEMSDEVYSVSVPAHSNDGTTNVAEGQNPAAAETTTPVKANAQAAVESQAAAAAAADLSAIDAAADASYDDSALSSEFTTADANTLTNSYDN